MTRISGSFNASKGAGWRVGYGRMREARKRSHDIRQPAYVPNGDGYTECWRRIQVMRIRCTSSTRSSFVFALLTLLLIACAAAQDGRTLPSDTMAPRRLITQPVDEARLTVLKGNTHPLARSAFDQGTAPASLPMQRMLLVLKRSPEQESALRKLLDDQQDKASPNYHKWLTPEQFGKQFGPSDSDLQTVTAWLQSRGFQIAALSKGRTVIEFSGSASQVQTAFHTSIHKYVVNGEQHWANASDPSIPAALAPAVEGVLTLHNFPRHPYSTVVGTPMRARHVKPRPCPCSPSRRSRPPTTASVPPTSRRSTTCSRYGTRALTAPDKPSPLWARRTSTSRTSRLSAACSACPRRILRSS